MGVTSISAKLLSKIANVGVWRLSCSVVAVVLVSVAAVVYADNSARPQIGSSPDSAENLTARQLADQDASMPQLASEQPSASGTLKPAETTSGGDMSGAKPETAVHDTNPSCQAKVSHLVKKYESEVAKEHKWLDDQLTYPPVGSLISAAYISDYNEKVQIIYASYAESARDENCSFDGVVPAILPPTYPN